MGRILTTSSRIGTVHKEKRNLYIPRYLFDGAMTFMIAVESHEYQKSK